MPESVAKYSDGSTRSEATGRAEPRALGSGERPDALSAGIVKGARERASDVLAPEGEARGRRAAGSSKPSSASAGKAKAGSGLAAQAGGNLKRAIADAAASEADDTEELSGVGRASETVRAARSVIARRVASKKASAASGKKKPPKGAGKHAKAGAFGRVGTARAQRAAAAQAAAASAKASASAKAAASVGGKSAIVGAVSSAAVPVAGVLAAILAFLLAVLAVSQIVSALFGFWENEASKASLEGLPPYITYEMVEAALECQEEYGHPAGCTIAKIIQESGQGDRMSQLAERDHNLFGMKWWSGYAGCPEVAGKANWATSEEYVPGEHTQITASFIRFTGDAECIRFRSRVFLQAERYSGNALIREAIERHDSDRMAEGLKDAGWATDSSYVESLKSIMAQWGLYRLDSMTVEDLKDPAANGNAIVEAAYSQLGVPYVWGGSTPGKALDCSGLTQYCYAQAGIRISHYTGSQYEELRRIPLSEAKPGDILYRSGHVAIYIGDDRYIHEPRTGDVCRIASGIGSFSCALTAR